MILTACNLKNTDLLVKRIETQVHWASQGQRDSKQFDDFADYDDDDDDEDDDDWASQGQRDSKRQWF